MTVMQIVQQLFGSMGITMEIFFVTLITSLILGLVWPDSYVKESDIVINCQILYFCHARYTIDAAAACCIFWPFFLFSGCRSRHRTA